MFVMEDIRYALKSHTVLLKIHRVEIEKKGGQFPQPSAGNTWTGYSWISRCTSAKKSTEDHFKQQVVCKYRNSFILHISNGLYKCMGYMV